MLQVQLQDEATPMQPWHIRDAEGLLDMTFTPFWGSYTQNKYVVVDTHCDQRYGTFAGVIQTQDGPRAFTGLPAFIEHAVNRW